LREDWDWNRLLKALKPRGEMERELTRLLADGFLLHAGGWTAISSTTPAPIFPAPASSGSNSKRRRKTAGLDSRFTSP